MSQPIPFRPSTALGDTHCRRAMRRVTSCAAAVAILFAIQAPVEAADDGEWSVTITPKAGSDGPQPRVYRFKGDSVSVDDAHPEHNAVVESDLPLIAPRISYTSHLDDKDKADNAKAADDEKPAVDPAGVDEKPAPEEDAPSDAKTGDAPPPAEMEFAPVPADGMPLIQPRIPHGGPAIVYGEGAQPPHGPTGYDYRHVYESIPFIRSEYDANPSYRHETTMELLFGQLRPTVIHKHQPAPLVAPRYPVRHGFQWFKRYYRWRGRYGNIYSPRYLAPYSTIGGYGYVY